jgi:ABC-type Mn2+/Zn2+ transport system permease subunit
VLEPFQLMFVQRGLIEIGLLSVAGGLIGTWIVLRGLAFFSHAVGTAAFPGLVLADGLSFSAHVGAAGTAALVAATVGWLARRDRERYDSITALVLVGSLTAGVLLASDVFHSGSNIDTLLFGSLLLVGPSDIAWAAGSAAVVLAATLILGPRWLATGFDAGSARGLGIRSSRLDFVLLGLVALVAVAALTAIGALLATAILVVPAATTRLFCTRLARWQLTTVALAAAEGTVGLWLSVKLNAPPGSTLAVLSGGVFALVAAGGALPRIVSPAPQSAPAVER